MKANGRLAVDTIAVIAYREGVDEVCALIDEADVIILPVTVLGELLYGALNSAKAEMNVNIIQEFAAYSLVMQIDEAVATCYAKVRLNLKKRGTPIPENDIWIAAACLELEVPLLSRDGHFKYIEELDVCEW